MLQIVKKNKSSLNLRHTGRTGDEVELVVKVGDAEKKFIVDNFDHISYDINKGVLKYAENTKRPQDRTTLARTLYRKLVSKKAPKMVHTQNPLDMRVTTFNA